MIPTALLPQPKTKEENPLGTLEILSVGDGHMTLSFDSKNPHEVEEAKQAVDDMMKRGYTIFVEYEGKYVPIAAFDAEKTEYVLKSSNSTARDPETKQQEKNRIKAEKKAERVRVKAEEARATAVAPTSGG